MEINRTAARKVMRAWVVGRLVRRRSPAAPMRVAVGLQAVVKEVLRALVGAAGPTNKVASDAGAGPNAPVRSVEVPAGPAN